jgi:hypothetical protein
MSLIVVITLRVMAACAASGVFLCDATEEPLAGPEKTRRCAGHHTKLPAVPEKTRRSAAASRGA